MAKGQKFQIIGYFRDIRAEEISDDIAREITSITNERELLDKIVEIVANTIKSETCSVLIYNENNERIEVFSQYGMPGPLKEDKSIDSYAEDDSLIGEVFVSGKTRNVSNIDMVNKQSGDKGIKWEYAEKYAKYSRFGGQ